jgi:hypothetical protein
MSDYVLEDEARAAIAPCGRCDLVVPHAFEDPDSHTWDPNHMVVNPADVLNLIRRLQACEEAPFG